MKEILEFLMKHCSFLYEKYGFRFTDSAISESFDNAALTLSIRELTIRFLREKGKLYLDFQSNLYGKKNAQSWYSMDIVRQLITGEKDYHSIMDAENASFLMNNIGVIIELFSQKNVKETIAKIKKLEGIRAKVLFG